MWCKLSDYKPFQSRKIHETWHKCVYWSSSSSRCLCSRQKIELPLMENVQTVPPPYVVRTVLIYSRHAGQLQFNPSEAVSVSMRTAEKSPPSVFLMWIWSPSWLFFSLSLLLIVLVSSHRRCCSLLIFSLMWSTYIMGWKSRGMRPAGGWVKKLINYNQVWLCTRMHAGSNLFGWSILICMSVVQKN